MAEREPAAGAAPAAAAVALGGYEADRLALLGRGSFGRVVRGFDRTANQPVAVKMVAMPSATAAAEDFDSVRREAVIGGALQHRNIARLFACVLRAGDTEPLETEDGLKQCANGAHAQTASPASACL